MNDAASSDHSTPSTRTVPPFMTLLAMVIGVFALTLTLASCKKDSKKDTSSTSSSPTTTKSDGSFTCPGDDKKTVTDQKFPDGLVVEDVGARGSGAKAEAGKTVQVHYTGWLTDGKSLIPLEIGREISRFHSAKAG